MKKTLRIIFNVYCIAGAIWLTFSILSLGVFNRTDRHRVSGTVTQLIRTEWDGIVRINAIIETDDDKGTVLATLYRAGVDTNDTVAVDISTGGKGRSYIHASISN